MAEDMAEKENLKQNLLATLGASLSFDQNERVKAEDQIKIFETTEEYGVILTEVTIELNCQQEIRQLASVLLKQYVDSHWSSLSEEKFKPPEATEQVKAFIRCNLPSGLKDDSSKIRTSVAYAISRIASFDWPDAWPELFPLLMEALHSMNANIIHGTMRVFTELAGEVTDLQIPHVAPVIFPEMLKIFANPEVYGIRTSARAAHIFSIIAGLIGLMKKVYKGIDKQHLYPYLPDFLNTCSQQLSTPDGPTSDCGFKMEILKALEILVKDFPKTLFNYMPNILPPVWSIFTDSVDRYVKTTVNCIDPSEDLVDEDGEILSFENLVFSVFEFISALVETPKFKKTVNEYLEQILFFTMVYMQITDEQIELWSNDPNQFVEDEDEETLSYSVRISAQYLILTLCEKFKNAGEKLCTAVARLKQKGDELRSQGDGNWWKYHEVCLLSLGYIQNTIIEKLESGELKDDFKSFLTEFLISSCCGEVPPFLLGQSFWTSSRFVSILSDDTISTFLHAAVTALQETQNTVLRVFAVKSLFCFCDYLKNADKSILLHPHLESIGAGLISMATQFTESVLAISLQTLNIVVNVNAEFTSKLVNAGNLVPLANALFLKYGSDHHLNPLIEDLIGELAKTPSCFQIVLEKTVPTLLSILEAPPDKIPTIIVAPTLDILTVIIRNGPKPLGETFVKRSFPIAVKKVIDSDDEAVIQNGGECIRAFVSCATEHVFSWQDGSGQNGLYYVVQVTCKLLDPRSSESTAAFVGKLINTLLMKAGSILSDSLEIILRSVLSKLQQAKTFTITQSLLMVFVQLIRHQINATLEFLSTVPGPTGKSALDYVLTEWCLKQPSFFGSYDTKVSCDALCKLLLHAIATGDARFQEIVVPEEEINYSQEIMTRSKTKQAQKQVNYIPVGIKLFKLILNELINQLENVDDINGDEDDDEDEDDWEDEDEGMGKDMSIQQTIEAMFSPAGDFAGLLDEDEDEDDDPDTADDPINQTDLKVSLSQFVQEFSQQPYFSGFTSSLNNMERECLQKVLTS